MRPAAPDRRGRPSVGGGPAGRAAQPVSDRLYGRVRCSQADGSVLLALEGRDCRQVTAQPRPVLSLVGDDRGFGRRRRPARHRPGQPARTSLTVRSTRDPTPSAATPSSSSSRRSAAPIFAFATCTPCSAAARSCSCSSTCAVASSARRSRATRSWSNADRRSRAFAIACCLLDTFDAISAHFHASGSGPSGRRSRPAHPESPPTRPGSQHPLRPSAS